MGIFFCTHGTGSSLGRIKRAGFLYYLPSAFNEVYLAINFVVYCPLHIAEGVHILHFHLGAKFILAYRTNRNVHITTHTSFFHVTVTNVQVTNKFTHFRKVVVGFYTISKIRLANHFQQWHTGTVQVYQRVEGIQIMNAFSRILLHMDARNANYLLIAVGIFN